MLVDQIHDLGVVNFGLESAMLIQHFFHKTGLAEDHESGHSKPRHLRLLRTQYHPLGNKCHDEKDDH